MSSKGNSSIPGACKKFKVFLVLCLFSVSSSDDLQVLLQLKSSLSKSKTKVFDSWNPENNLISRSPCKFSGISCNSNQSVTSIDLPYSQVSGWIDFGSVCELKSLTKLDLGGNSLFGNITDGLKNCTKLTYLDLSLNSFSGAMPDLSNLVDLRFLNLNKTGISGEFPWESLEKLSSLEFLSVGDNPLLLRSKFPTEVVNLNKLYWLYLSNCSLEGQIPKEIGNLTELSNLELSSNYLSGEIPETIAKLTKLRQLELYSNELSGKIPLGFRNLISLKRFDASANRLEGDLSEIKSLSNLESLQLFENKLSGEVPEEFGEFKFLVNLSLYGNMLTGPLPQKLGSWADFNFIDVSENHLTGEIPPDMCKRGSMQKLLMLQNRFNGSIPANYANCSSMTRFRVSNNSLSGAVPEALWGLPNLDFLDLADNRFEGSIGPAIQNAKLITQLHLQNNIFSGQLPPEMFEASSLKLIDLSFNRFSGDLSPGIQRLTKLNSLYLQGNGFSGEIPNSITQCAHLNNIDLSQNSFSGDIPSSLGSLESLNSLNLSRNQLTGGIPDSLSSLKLSLLDLSNNRLSGPIPQSLQDSYSNERFFGNPDLCSSSIRFFKPCPSDSPMSPKLRTILSCLLVLTTLVLVVVAMLIFVRRRARDRKSSKSGSSWDVKSFRILNFTEQEITSAIKAENLIGKGGSGNVYRVVLDNGKDLAVKHIWNNNNNNNAEDNRKRSRSGTAAMLMRRSGYLPEFDAEVAALSSVQHVNVVKLYCSITSDDSSLLVYEYLPHGSLWDRMHSCDKVNGRLDWEARYEIALGAAKGLEYLHHGCTRPVIHRDVKSSNILLDEFLKPRIADFGLAKIVQGVCRDGKDSTHVIAGTHGYIAPEYAYTYKVNEKSDVYSFGVVLMELVTGKRPIEPEYGENKDIVYWVCGRMTSRESILGLVDSSIPIAVREDAVKVLRVAVLCTTRLPALRPSMRAVVQMLEDAEPCRLITIAIDKSNSRKHAQLAEYKDGKPNSNKLSP
ncbi:hypothetical protein Sjap_018884 [Stephania japonica]|uniref:non-specific serine/threonine protein kinase n=1 Tax=Stephania japonica TaxID=461633 RepID=A0AAP0I8R8_9MAGN